MSCNCPETLTSFLFCLAELPYSDEQRLVKTKDTHQALNGTAFARSFAHLSFHIFPVFNIVFQILLHIMRPMLLLE